VRNYSPLRKGRLSCRAVFSLLVFRSLLLSCTRNSSGVNFFLIVRSDHVNRRSALACHARDLERPRRRRANLPRVRFGRRNLHVLSPRRCAAERARDHRSRRCRIFVCGIADEFSLEPTSSAQERTDDRCAFLSDEKLFPRGRSAVEERVFRGSGQVHGRIEVYRCAESRLTGQDGADDRT
jgi:hypothetical protein